MRGGAARKLSAKLKFEIIILWPRLTVCELSQRPFILGSVIMEKVKDGDYHEASNLARSARPFGRPRARRRLLRPRRLWRWLLWRRRGRRRPHPARDPSRPASASGPRHPRRALRLRPLRPWSLWPRGGGPPAGGGGGPAPHRR